MNGRIRDAGHLFRDLLNKSNVVEQGGGHGFVRSNCLLCSFTGLRRDPHWDGFEDGFCQVRRGILMSGFIASPYAESRQEEAEKTFLDS